MPLKWFAEFLKGRGIDEQKIQEMEHEKVGVIIKI